ncbi:MAG: hypothetical protein ABW201_04185 [Candidatus Thiodiazotropha sp.]
MEGTQLLEEHLTVIRLDDDGLGKVDRGGGSGRHPGQSSMLQYPARPSRAVNLPILGMSISSIC